MDAKLTAMITEAATKGLVDQGKLIEAGFTGFKLMTLQHASPEQIADMRIAFFAGAQHLWGSVMTMLDPGENETDADMSRMDKIDTELKEFGKTLSLMVQRPKGSG